MNLSVHLVLIADESQAKQETSEGIIFIFDFLFRCGHTLYFLTHSAKDRNEIGVVFCTVRVGLRKPRECHAVLLHFNSDVVYFQGLLYKVPFGIQEFCKITNVHLIEWNLDQKGDVPS